VSRTGLWRRAALSWARGRELSPQRLWPLLREPGGLESLLGSSEEELSERLGSRARALAILRSVDDTDTERWIRDVERSGIQAVTPFDSDYPRLLLEIPDPPFVLFCAGNLERFRSPAVAVVGSRDASRYGRDVASRLARDLSSVGVTVVSGFARGVDEAAHEAAMEGAGGTLAVLGCGIDVDYPREHTGLKVELLRRNLMISEFVPGTEPRPANFPVRNRIIAGLATGVVVVEASRRSGSLITARLAGDFGRDVFAVPGSVFSATSAGSHELLRDGAILCRGAEDVLAEIFPTLHAPASARADAPRAHLSVEAQELLTALRRESSSAEELALEKDWPAATVLTALFELEEAGLATSDEQGRYGLRRG
jgi:DNA processing protein